MNSLSPQVVAVRAYELEDGQRVTVTLASGESTSFDFPDAAPNHAFFEGLAGATSGSASDSGSDTESGEF